MPNTNPRHSAPFCARCSYTKLMHGRLGGACSNFIAPSSAEARELTKPASLALVPLDDEAATLRMLADDAVPLAVDEEETTKVETPSDAQLLADWRGRQETP